MPAVKENIAVFSGVTKIYRKRGLVSTPANTALNSLSFELARGEIIGLLGLNGAGKTTIMKLLTGLLFPTAGSVSVFGLPPGDVLSKRRIGFLPELPYFYPYVTAASSLLYYARLSGLGRSAARERLEVVIGKTGLEKHAGRRVSEFSKGLMQRLGIAQAVIHDPELLILDEPVSGLDPLAIHDIRTLISDFNAAGKTVFLSSHSISELEKITDRVLIMVQGRLARTVSRLDWESARGGLEGIFVETVRNSQS